MKKTLMLGLACLMSVSLMAVSYTHLRILRAETAALAAIHGTSFYYDMAGDKQ